jgi:threonylcarbamoyladenosine tRNA methylthiotransferase MtaB
LQGGNNTVSFHACAKTVAVASIGCRTNQEEMEALRNELWSAGFVVVDDLKSADIVIVNTCSVTSHTESKTKRLLLAITREAPQAKIVATGCLAQQLGDELVGVGNVAWVVGNARKHEIPALVRTTQGGLFFGDLVESVVPPPAVIGNPLSSGRTRFSLKIQEGCNYACAYCIVPRLRGPSRSAAATEIVSACRAAIDAGYKEIVLTGTHIGQYRDPVRGPGFFSIVDRLLALEGDFRLRLSSLDPRELPGELLDSLGRGGKLCDHLHLSLQSLSAEVLRAMGRPVADLDALIERLIAFRARAPYAGLGADFIVGFPGETDAQFESTLRQAARIGFSYGHIFRFSPRPGTPAASMPATIPEAVKTARSARLRAAIDASRQRFVKSHGGQTRRIIVEREQPLRGITSNYLSIEIPSSSAPHNSWREVVLDGTSRNGKYCNARLADSACTRLPIR